MECATCFHAFLVAAGSEVVSNISGTLPVAGTSIGTCVGRDRGSSNGFFFLAELMPTEARRHTRKIASCLDMLRTAVMTAAAVLLATGWCLSSLSCSVNK